ncbi:MAG: ROK family transcriptional regulator [Deltaproteobacteria bacterium]|nr:ROK family transcriptional regulator [Deltaproteobacteria bacterium]
MIWRERRISRAEIARRTGLSRSTVSSIVSDLLPTGLVAEVGSGASRGGRKPIVLEFQDDAYRILGVDMGATHVSVALTDLRGKVIAWQQEAHPVREDPQGTMALMGRLAEACLASSRKGARGLLGIGVAVPSPVDPRHPERLSDVVMPAWRGFDVVHTLRARFGVHVLVDNDANLGALAEHFWGAGRGVEDSAYIKVATGIGSGHIIGARIYRGSSGTAGEIGHIAIDPKGPVCLCGLRGCLVTLVGTPALVERARALLKKFPKSPLHTKKLSITTIEDAALAHDPLSLQVVREAADNLGIAVAGMLNLMNPAVVSIGGSLARLGDLLVLPLRESVRSRTLVSSVAAARIVASELGERDVATGAATLVLQAALADLGLFASAAAGR